MSVPQVKASAGDRGSLDPELYAYVGRGGVGHDLGYGERG